MISKELKKLAEAQGLKIENEVAYGKLNDCFVTLVSGAGYQRMYIYAGAAQGAEGEVLNSGREIAQKIAELAADFDTYHIVNDKKNLPGERHLNGIALKNGGALVQVNFYADRKTMGCVENFIRDILPQVAPMTDMSACMKCAQDNNDTTVPVLLSDEAVVPMHKECADAYAAEVAAKNQEKKHTVRGGNNFTGVIGAFIGAMLGAVVWAVVGMIGYIAGIVGWLTAFLSGKGFDLLGGKSIKVKLTAVIVFVLIAILVGNMAVLAWQLHEYYVAETAGMSALQLKFVEAESEWLPVAFVEQLSVPETQSAMLKDIGIGILFAAWACLYLLREMAQKAKPQVVVLKG